MHAYKIEAATAQYSGTRSAQNDRVALLTSAKAPGYMLALLADGGTCAAGAEQALHTGKHLFDAFRASDNCASTHLASLLHEIAQEADTVIKMSPMIAALEPRSTLTLLLLAPHGLALWAHVGDSRLYRFAGARCVLRSNDAAYVDHLIGQEGLPPDAARKHRNASLLANVLGNTARTPFVTIGSHAGLREGDAFLLCSDGLWQYFTDAELAAVVARKSPRQAAERLVDKARERAAGNGDNCSMAIVKLVKPDSSAAGDAVPQKPHRAR